MLKYFLLRPESDPKVLGVDNGIKQADIKRDGFHSPEKYDQLKMVLGTNKYWELKDSIGRLDLELQCAKLLPKAKLTDFLQFGPFFINCPFLISKKVLEIFSRHKISAHDLFPATVKAGSKSYSYYLPHWPGQSDDIIDYSRSTFYMGSPIFGKKTHVFASADEKRNFEKKNVGLEMDEIFLNEKFDSSLDFFVMHGATMVISERLKAALQAASASGVKMLPAFGKNVLWAKIFLTRQS